MPRPATASCSRARRPVAGDGAALRAVMESDLARWSEVVRAKGITVQD